MDTCVYFMYLLCHWHIVLLSSVNTSKIIYRKYCLKAIKFIPYSGRFIICSYDPIKKGFYLVFWTIILLKDVCAKQHTFVCILSSRNPSYTLRNKRLSTHTFVYICEWIKHPLIHRFKTNLNRFMLNEKENQQFNTLHQ